LAEDFRVSLIGELNEAATKKEIESDLKKIEKSVGNIDIGKLTSMNQTFKKTKEGTKELNKEILTFKNSLGQTTRVTKDAQGNIEKVSQSMKVLKTESKKTTDTTKKLTDATKEGAKASMSFGQQTLEAAKKFGIWSAVTSIYFAAIRGLKQMVDEVKNLDDALVEMSKVSELSGESLQRFGDIAADVGKKINATAADVVNAAADFSRMGFGEEESLRLAEDALVLTKIADGITEVDEATKALTSTLKGFNMDASESRHIIDALNEVSNNFAINTDDLAEGLRRTAGVMAQSNTSFEETIGLITGAQESLQQIEKVSSGLITISTRLRKVGESTEDVNGLTVKLDEAFRKYTDGAVRIEDANGSMRSTYDILTDLAQVWDTLDDKSQAYLGFLASGTRQTPVLNSLMSNLNNTISATSTAMDSAGSAQEEFNKVMNSLQGRLDKLGATWSRIATDFISSGFLKMLLDMVTEISSLVESVGMLNIVLLGLSVIFAKNASKMLPFLDGLVSMGIGFETIGIKATLAAAGVTGLQIAMGGIAIVVGAVAAAFVILNKQHQEFIRDTKESNEELEIYIKQWEKLNEVQRENAKLKANEIVADLRTEYKEAKEELVGLNEELDRLDKALEIENMGNQTDNAENLSKAVSELRDRQSELNLVIETFEDALAISNGSLDEKTKKEKEVRETSIALTESWKSQLETNEEVIKSLKQSITIYTKVQDKIKEITKDYEFMSDAGKEQARAFIQNEIDKSKKLKEAVLERIKLYQAEFDAMLKLIMMGEETLTTGQLKRFTELSSGIGALVERVEEITISTNKLESTFDDITKTTEETTKALKDLSSQIESENVKAVEKYRDTIVEALDEEKELIDRNKEAWERDFEDRQTASDRYYEDLLDSYDAETDALKEKREIEEEIADIQKTQVELTKLQEKLADISKQRNVRVLTASGWQWVADPSEIAKANEEIADMEETLAEQQQAKLEADQDRSREATRRHYEEEKLIVDRAFEDEQTIVERGYEDQYNTIDFWLDEIKDEESSNYADRISNLQTFVNNYNAEMAKMGGGAIGTPKTPTIQDPGGTPTSQRDETIQQMKLNSAQWGAASETEKKRLADENLKLGGSIGWSRNPAGEWIDESGKRAYANGGLNNYTGDAAMHGTSTRPEMVLNNTQAAGLFNFVKSLSNMDMSSMMNKTPVSSGGGDTYNLKIMAPNGATLSGLLTQAKQMSKHGR